MCYFVMSVLASAARGIVGWRQETHTEGLRLILAPQVCGRLSSSPEPQFLELLRKDAEFLPISRDYELKE